jgi:glycerol-3-phosphate acyltransferase PlsX
MTTVCVDAMGGDDAVQKVLDGVTAALEDDAELKVLLAGNDEVVTPFCERNERAEALVTTEVIGMGEHPVTAVRQKKDSSIVRGCAAVRQGAADGFFSAGSTGAVLAAATLGVGRIKGIKRPAITFALPGLAGHETVMLDLGANADCRPEMIVQFAHMGAAYATVELGVESPRVALLSNGTEDAKGSEATIAAHEALAAADVGFVGNCEGSDLLLGDYDVIVCDGFTGNVALKSMEGTAKYIVAQVKAAAEASKRSALGALMLKPALKGVAASLSGDAHGGAVLLGLKAPVLIGHGSTSKEAIRNGIHATSKAVRSDLVSKIAERCAA